MKKMFSKNLFIEGFLQLRGIGITLFIICVISAYIQPLLMWLNINKNMNYIVAPSLNDVSIWLTLYVLIAPILMSLILFSFLNKRKGSDFYHNLPQNRACIFTSFVLSILAWVFITIIAIVVINALTYSIFNLYYNLYYIPYLIFSFLAYATLITSAVLIAMSLTGTIITNLIVTGTILLLPQSIILIFSSTLNKLPIMANILTDGLGSNLNYNNIAEQTILSFFNLGASSNTFIPTVINTFILSILYLVIGGFLFNKRKSESTDKPFVNSNLQHAVRIAVTLPLALFIPCFIFSNMTFSTFNLYMGSFKFRPTSFILVALLSLLIYFLFELLISHNFKSLYRTIPFLLIIVVIDVLFGISMFICKDYVLSIKPSPAMISSVSFINERNGFYNGPDSYNNLKLEEIEYSDPVMLELISNTLNNDIYYIKNGTFEAKHIKPSALYVKIKLKDGRSIKRVINNMAINDSNIFFEHKLAYSENIATLNSYPPEQSIKIISVGPNKDFSEDELKNIWETYKSEYVMEKDYSSQNDKIELLVYGNIGINNYLNKYYITKDTPKTLKLINN